MRSVTTTWRAPAWRATAVGHHADRPGPGDQHVLAQGLKVSAVCTALPSGSKIAATSGSTPSRWCQTLVIGSDDVLGEGARPVDADATGVGAEMAPAGQAVAAAAADDVALAADEVAEAEVVDVGADRDDLADELVADDHRHRDGLLRPRRPSCRCGRRCRRCRSCATAISTSLMPTSGSGTSESQRPGSACS